MVSGPGARQRDPLEDLRRNYAVAFLRYLPRRDEAPLLTAYDLGRRSLEEGGSLLDLIRVHHQVLAQVLGDSPDHLPELLDAATDFLCEVLAATDMAQRAILSRPPE